jgi:23S rRNA pseudouridine2457 synthase
MGAIMTTILVSHQDSCLGSPVTAMLLAFHKPYGVISQFTPDGSPHRTLAEFGFPQHVYPVGRLDATSEGLLLLSDEAALNQRLLHPSFAHDRTYWVQVERVPTEETLARLAKGIIIADYQTLPCQCHLITPQVPPREPPIRSRQSVPTAWLAMTLREGKYHQVRRMTAAVGHPTLRLLRVQIANIILGELAAGRWRELAEIDLHDGVYRANCTSHAIPDHHPRRR